MKLSFHPSAKYELYEAATYYESIEKRLGKDFKVEVWKTIQRILDFPEA